MYISIMHTKCFNALTGIQATTIYSKIQQSRKATVYHSGRHATVRDVVFRDIKTTTVTQMRDVHIRDKIIKDCILLGSLLTVGMFSSRIVSCLHQINFGDLTPYLTYGTADRRFNHSSHLRLIFTFKKF
jgi:hypothetical protein